MNVPFQGGCQCGALRYECTEEPTRIYHCHCAACRRATGTAFHTGLLVKRSAFRFLKGQAKTWDRDADSGNRVTEAFCEQCGSPIYVCSSGRPDGMSIKAGSLDDPYAVKATGQIWLAGAVPWHDTCLAEDRHEAGYPMGPVRTPTGG